MNLRRLTPSLIKTTALSAVLLLTPLPAAPQATADATRTAEVAPVASGLRDLQQQMQELSGALRDMRAELQDARAQVVELRQELTSAGDQLAAMKSQLAASNPPASSVGPQPSASAASGGSAVKPLESRVAQLEEGQQLLGEKVDDQYQTKVESGSKYRMRLSGMALFNAFTTRGPTDNFDVPEFAAPSEPPSSNGAFGATLRQSILGLDVFGPEIDGAKTEADIRADFFGGFPSTPNGVNAGFVRLRTAGLHLDWQNTSVVAGQYTPFISPLSPTSIASVAYPALASSGNLWVWTPELYVEHRLNLSGGSSVSLEAGILDPMTGEFPEDSYYRSPQAGERAGQPAYAARIGWGQGTASGPLALGFGGYYARQNWGLGQTVDAWAGTADWQVPLSHGFGLTGEFYRGRALGGLGAAEAQSVICIGTPGESGTVVRPINSTGGWTQLKFMPLEKLEFNGIFGEDFSTPSTLPYPAEVIPYQPGSFGRNGSIVFNSIYHLRSNLLFSVEYHRLRTAEIEPGIVAANQVSLSAATFF